MELAQDGGGGGSGGGQGCENMQKRRRAWEMEVGGGLGGERADK
jgi:hypothetical protein